MSSILLALNFPTGEIFPLRGGLNTRALSRSAIQPGVGGVLKGRNDVALICEPTYGVNRFFKCGSPEKKTNSRRRTYGLQVRIYGYGTAIRRSGD